MVDRAVAAITERLLADAKEIETEEQIVATASISAGDPEIGAAIAEAMTKAGKEGVITVEESNTRPELELTEGMSFDKGFLSMYFMTDTGASGSRPGGSLHPARGHQGLQR